MSEIEWNVDDELTDSELKIIRAAAASPAPIPDWVRRAAERIKVWAYEPTTEEKADVIWEEFQKETK